MVADFRKSALSSLPELGRGGFGTVKFTWVEGKQMAVKVVKKPSTLSPEATTNDQTSSTSAREEEYVEQSKYLRAKQQNKVDCSRQEASLLGLLSHKNIVRLYKLEEDEEELRMYLEYVPGLNFQETLERRTDSSMKEEEARSFFKSLVEAMVHAHSRNICHFDLKPENVITHPIHGIKIIDFGLGALLEDDTKPLVSGCSRGTLAYTAPEVLNEAPLCTKAADVWSLGVFLYLMLTGKTPFSGDTQWELRDNIVKPTEAFIPAFLSQECQDLLAQMLKKDPNARPSIDQVSVHTWFTLQIPKLSVGLTGSANLVRSTPNVFNSLHSTSALHSTLTASCPSCLLSISEEDEDEVEEEMSSVDDCPSDGEEAPFPTEDEKED